MAPKGVVWIVNQYATTPSHPGITRHYDLATELARKGFRVRVFASSFNHTLRQKTQKSGRATAWTEHTDGFHLTWIKTAEYTTSNYRRVWSMLHFAWRYLLVTVRLRPRPDVVVGSSPHLLAALSAWFLARVKSAAFVLELRDMWPDALVDLGMSRIHPGILLLSLVERFLIRVADWIVILSPAAEPHVVNKGANPLKMTCIPNAVYLRRFDQWAREHSATRLGGLSREDDCFVVAYTGAHGPANSLRTVIEAAEICSDDCSIRFVLLGDGPCKDELIRMAKQKRLTNVLFGDALPKCHVPSFLQFADAGLLTLRSVKTFSWGVSPNKLFDYFAAAKPVICAAPGLTADLVASNEAGIAVEAENPVALAAAIKRLSRMSVDERQEMGLRGRRMVERQFSVENSASAFAECMQTLLGVGEVDAH